MVAAFKYLNYMQLAKSSLVSKRYSNLIFTHRHSLALLYVDSICMSENYAYAAYIKIFNKMFSPKAYSEWIIRNQYSKQIPLQGQVGKNQSVQYGRQLYEMKANYIDSNEIACAFTVYTELNHENWPLFQHFVRLLTDSFIYIRSLELTPRIDITFINLLADAMNPYYDRLQCDELELYSNRINLQDNVLKFIVWIKDYVLCNEFRINYDIGSNYDEELLDLFVTGANCTSAIWISNDDPSNVIMALLQKFMLLKRRDECQIVESIQGYVEVRADIAEFKRNFTEFIAEEEQYEEDDGTRQIIGLINNDIKKTLTLSVRKRYISAYFSIKITDL